MIQQFLRRVKFRLNRERAGKSDPRERSSLHGNFHPVPFPFHGLQVTGQPSAPMRISFVHDVKVPLTQAPGTMTTEALRGLQPRDSFTCFQ
jgi:hypothetical protein